MGFGESSVSVLETLLEEGGSISIKGLGKHLLSLLDEGLGLDVLCQEVSCLGQDSDGLVVISHQLLEFFVLFNSLGIKVVNVLLVSSDFSVLSFNDTFHNGSSGIEISL